MLDGKWDETINNLPETLQTVFRVLCSEAVNLQKRVQNELGDEVAILLTIKVKSGPGGSFMLPGESDPFPEATGYMMAARCLAKFGPEAAEQVLRQIAEDQATQNSKAPS